MDQLGAIDLFNRVVETGSFSEAGRQANLAPSSVSRRIVDLEDWLGVTLFYRTTRRLNLTDAGRQFHSSTKSILLDLEEAKTKAAGLESTPAGLVRVSLPASLEQHIVAATSKFQVEWPEVSFGLTSTDLNVDLVSEGFDLAIRAGKLADSSLRARKLAEVKRRLCASPDYLASSPNLKHPHDLAHHSCLVLRRNPGANTWEFRDGRKRISVEASGEFTANSGNMLLTAARQGRGIVLSPDWIVGPYLASGELREVLPDYAPNPSSSTLYAVYPYKKFVPPKVRMFIEFLVKYFGAQYDWSKNPLA